MEGFLKAALEAGRVFLRGDSPGGMLQSACEALCGKGGFNGAFVVLPDPEGSACTAFSFKGDEDLLESIRKGNLPGFVRTALQTPGVTVSGRWTGCRFETPDRYPGALFVGYSGDDPGVHDLLAGVARDLSFALERNSAIRDREETRNLLAEVYRNAPVLMLVADMNMRIIMANDHVCETTGRPLSEITGLKGGDALRCVHSQDHPLGCGHGPHCVDCAVKNMVLDTMTGGEPHHQEEVAVSFTAGGVQRERTLLMSTTRLEYQGEHAVLVALHDITERKAAEDQLIEAHSRLNTIMDITNTRLDVIDRDFNLIYVDPGWMKLHGDPRGHKCYAYFMGRDVPCDGCAIPMAIETGEVQVAEHTLLSEGGRVVEVHTIPMKGPEGELLVAEFNIDVTDRKRVEEELRAGENYLRSVFRAAPVGIGIVRDRVLTEVNPTMCSMTGYTRDELLGRSARILYPSDEDFDFVGTEKYRQIRERGAGTVETRFRRKTGEIMDILLSSTPLDPADLSRGVTFTALDISDAKASARSLRESEEYLKAVFQSMNDGVFVDDAETMEIIDVNDTVCRMYGYTREEVIRRRIAGMSVDEPPYDQAHAVAHLERARLEGPQVFQWKARHRSGRTFWVEVNATYAEIVGKPRFIVTVRDISDRKAAEEEKLKLERQVHQAQKLESLGVLAGGIAHDFNNILMVIMGNAQLASREAPSDSPAQEHLSDIELAAHRASELCRQMLAYSGRAAFSMEVVSLSSLVREMAHLLKTSVSKKAALVLNLDESGCFVAGDPAQLRQVVMNLIINASESLMEHQGTISVTLVRCVLDGSGLEGYRFGGDPLPGDYAGLEIADTGCGMDEDAASRMFDPFFTTKFAGRGLGLVAVLGIMKAHGGGIQVVSAPGEGTTVRVLFPLVEQASAVPEEGGPSPSESWAGHGALLLVDDEKSLRDLGGKMLSLMGFQVETASDGIEALELIRDRGSVFRGVLLDMTMPRMDGLETCLELRRLYPELKVIMISGYSGEDMEARFRGKGISGFLQKPFTLMEMRSLLARVFP